jgi:hypothetical protein
MAGSSWIWKKSTESAERCTLRPRASHRWGHHLREPQSPRSQHNAFKKGMTPKHRRWPVRWIGPRVSPGMEGRSGSTQEHASKEEVAPAGVTVIRIGNAEQGFHLGRRPHPGKKETSSSRTTAEGSLSTRRIMSTTAVGVPPHAKKGPRWSRQSGVGTPRLRRRSPAPLTLGKTNEVR